MVAQAVGSFDNGKAQDWVDYLMEHVDDPWYLDFTFDAVGADRSDVDRCREAIAAAELVAAAGHKARPGLDDEVQRWVERHWTELWNGKRRPALGAVREILRSSALRALWEKTDQFEAWQADVEELAERLS